MTVSAPIEATAASIAPCTDAEPPSKTLPPVDTLFVWDFDWTIVNCNSDEYVPARFLGDAATNRRLRHMIDTLGPDSWHDCVASLINSCMEEIENCSKSDICEAAASMPYLADVRGSLEDVANDAKCGQAIISDGNDVFIGAFLKKSGLEYFFTHGIETNVGNWEESGEDAKCTFSVLHQSTKYGGHSSKRCPSNLCKSQVLQKSLLPNTRRPADFSSDNSNPIRPRIIYVGDGSNDACPALQVLNEKDVLLARDGKRISNPNSKVGMQEDPNADDLTGSSFPIISVLERAREDGMVPKCRVCTWNSGADLRALVRSLLDETQQFS